MKEFSWYSTPMAHVDLGEVCVSLHLLGNGVGVVGFACSGIGQMFLLQCPVPTPVTLSRKLGITVPSLHPSTPTILNIPSTCWSSPRPTQSPSTSPYLSDIPLSCLFPGLCSDLLFLSCPLQSICCMESKLHFLLCNWYILKHISVSAYQLPHSHVGFKLPMY